MDWKFMSACLPLCDHSFDPFQALNAPEFSTRVGALKTQTPSFPQFLLSSSRIGIQRGQTCLRTLGPLAHKPRFHLQTQDCPLPWLSLSQVISKAFAAINTGLSPEGSQVGLYDQDSRSCHFCHVGGGGRRDVGSLEHRSIGCVLN